MTDPRWSTRKLALENGWFSRRHENGIANTDAREKYQETRGRAARQRRALERNRNAA